MAGNEETIIIKRTSTRNEVAAWIKSTLEETRLGSSVIKAVFDLPPMKKVPGPVLADAIKMVLDHYSIVMPSEIYDKIKKDVIDSFIFYSPSMKKELQPREVKIDNSSEISIMLINGVEPVDGENGRVEFYFDYTVKPGKIMADGTIDFRDINRFPQARKGDHILRKYDATMGSNGTDVYGSSIVPVPGIPHPSVIDTETLEKKEGVDEDKGVAFADWYALKSGIIEYSFINNDTQPDFLEKISIKNQIVVKNIDFTTGNITGDDNSIKCAADLLVEGDVKGRFSVQIDGSLDVKGSVEGEKIEVSDTVRASCIRSNIRCGRYVEAGAAISAKIFADESVTVLREISNCVLSAPDVFLRGSGEGLLCGRVMISAWHVEAINVMVRNQVDIRLGDSLFEKMEVVERQLAETSADIERKSAAFRDLANALGQKLQNLSIINDKECLDILNRLKKIAGMLLRGELSTVKVRKALSDIASGNMCNMKGIVTLIFNIADMEDSIAVATNKHKAVLAKKKKIEKDMESLSISFYGRISPAGQVNITCGTKKIMYESKSSSKKENIQIVLRYDPVYGLVGQEAG